MEGQCCSCSRSVCIYQTWILAFEPASHPGELQYGHVRRLRDVSQRSRRPRARLDGSRSDVRCVGPANRAHAVSLSHFPPRERRGTVRSPPPPLPLLFFSLQLFYHRASTASCIANAILIVALPCLTQRRDSLCSRRREIIARTIL